jgi:hypothetical protein
MDNSQPDYDDERIIGVAMNSIYGKSVMFIF